jgi:hypothetical protein
VFRLAQFELADPTFRKSAPFYFAPPIFFRNNTCGTVCKQRLLSPFYSALSQNPVRRSSGSYSQKPLSFLCSIICAHKSCVCHSYKNNRGVPKLFPLWNSLNPLSAHNGFISHIQSLPHYFLTSLLLARPALTLLLRNGMIVRFTQSRFAVQRSSGAGQRDEARPHQSSSLAWGHQTLGIGMAPQLPAARAVQERDVS